MYTHPQLEWFSWNQAKRNSCNHFYWLCKSQLKVAVDEMRMMKFHVEGKPPWRQSLILRVAWDDNGIFFFLPFCSRWQCKKYFRCFGANENWKILSWIKNDLPVGVEEREWGEGRVNRLQCLQRLFIQRIIQREFSECYQNIRYPNHYIFFSCFSFTRCLSDYIFCLPSFPELNSSIMQNTFYARKKSIAHSPFFHIISCSLVHCSRAACCCRSMLLVKLLHKEWEWNYFCACYNTVIIT